MNIVCKRFPNSQAEVDKLSSFFCESKWADIFCDAVYKVFDTKGFRNEFADWDDELLTSIEAESYLFCNNLSVRIVDEETEEIFQIVNFEDILLGKIKPEDLKINEEISSPYLSFSSFYHESWIKE